MLHLKPLSPGFGLEATGINLSGPISDEMFAEIEDAFFDGQVLAIPHQRLTPARFVAFARRFGPPEPHVIDQFHHPDDRNILILSGTELELKHLVATIDMFDINWMAGMSAGLFTLQSADVKSVVAPTFRHRLLLRPEAEVSGHTADTVLGGVLASVTPPR